MLAQNEGSRMMYGFGYNIEFFSIENLDAYLKGNMLTYGGTFIMRGFLSGNTAFSFWNASANFSLAVFSCSFFIQPPFILFEEGICCRKWRCNPSLSVFTLNGDYIRGLLSI